MLVAVALAALGFTGNGGAALLLLVIALPTTVFLAVNGMKPVTAAHERTQEPDT